MKILNRKTGKKQTKILKNSIMEEKITITRNMVRKFSAVMITLITIWGVLQLWQFRADKNEALKNAEKLHKIEQDSAVARERRAIMKRDSIYSLSQLSKKEVELLKNEVQASRKEDQMRTEKYQKSINDLNKIKNEKAHIPTNITIAEQSDFLSKYKYKEY